MENASKALLIAGGVIIGVMILALLVYVQREMSKVQVNEISEEQIEQLQLFNQEFESYNKPSMHGTDVITVINKAIDNNKRYDYEDRIYDIEIEFTILSDIVSSATQYYTTASGRIGETYIGEKNIRDNNSYTIYELGTILSSGKHTLIDNSHDRLNDDITNLMKMNFESKKININPNNKNEYTLVTSGFSDFKSKYFRCTKLEYSDVTGRVNKMVFKELDLN